MNEMRREARPLRTTGRLGGGFMPPPRSGAGLSGLPLIGFGTTNDPAGGCCCACCCCWRFGASFIGSVLSEGAASCGRFFRPTEPLQVRGVGVAEAAVVDSDASSAWSTSISGMSH